MHYIAPRLPQQRVCSPRLEYSRLRVRVNTVTRVHVGMHRPECRRHLRDAGGESFAQGRRMPEVIFNGADGRLEGRYHHGPGGTAPLALILHPHPLHGGTMNNKIVYDLFYVFARRGFPFSASISERRSFSRELRPRPG